MQNIQFDYDEKALLIHSLQSFIHSNTPYINSPHASGHNYCNLLVAKRVLHKLQNHFDYAELNQILDVRQKMDLNRKIQSLDLTMRVKNFLVSAEITTLYELVNVSEKELIKQPHCGRKTIFLIKQFLDQNGLSLLQE